MTGYTPEALRQISELRGHYEQRERTEAIHAPDTALYEAERKIEADPAAGIPAPRPYPELAWRGRAWVKAGPLLLNLATAEWRKIARVLGHSGSQLGTVLPGG